jgi:hypothetical protein
VTPAGEQTFDTIDPGSQPFDHRLTHGTAWLMVVITALRGFLSTAPKRVDLLFCRNPIRRLADSQQNQIFAWPDLGSPNLVLRLAALSGFWSACHTST